LVSLSVLILYASVYTVMSNDLRSAAEVSV